MAQLNKITLSPAIELLTGNAGAGKTKELIDRMMHQHAIRKFSFVCLAFNKDKVEDLKGKLAKEIARSEKEAGQDSTNFSMENLQVHTIHSFCLKILSALRPEKAKKIQTSLNVRTDSASSSLGTDENDPENISFGIEPAELRRQKSFNRMLSDYLTEINPTQIQTSAALVPMLASELLIVDEIQDLRPSHLAVIDKIITDFTFPHIVLAGDLNQIIYAFASNPKPTSRELDYIAQTRLPRAYNISNPADHAELSQLWPKLKDVRLQNTPNRFSSNLRIAHAANAWLSFMHDSPKHRYDLELPLSHGEKPKIYLMTDMEQVRAKAIAILQTFSKARLPKKTRNVAAATAILAYTNYERELMKEAIAQHAISNPEHDWMKDVKVSTIHSFKGSEADNVIVLNLNIDIVESDQGRTHFNSYTSLFYVALTRPKKRLFIITSHKARRLRQTFKESCQIVPHQQEVRMPEILNPKVRDVFKREHRNWRCLLEEWHIAGLNVSVCLQDMPFIPLMHFGSIAGRDSKRYVVKQMPAVGDSKSKHAATMVVSFKGSTKQDRRDYRLNFSFRDLDHLTQYRMNDLSILRSCVQMVREFFDNRIRAEAILIDKIKIASLRDFEKDRSALKSFLERPKEPSCAEPDYPFGRYKGDFLRPSVEMVTAKDSASGIKLHHLEPRENDRIRRPNVALSITWSMLRRADEPPLNVVQLAERINADKSYLISHL